MPGGRPKKFKSVKELQEKMDAYFDKCDLTEQPYTVLGLCLELDCDRETLLNYSKDKRFFGTIKKAKMRVEEYLEKRLQKGTPVGTIFNLKNNFGWKDKQEQEIDHTFSVSRKVYQSK